MFDAKIKTHPMEITKKGMPRGTNIAKLTAYDTIREK